MWGCRAHKSHPTDLSSHAEMDVGINIPHKLYLRGKFESTFKPQQEPHQSAVRSALDKMWYYIGFAY